MAARTDKPVWRPSLGARAKKLISGSAFGSRMWACSRRFVSQELVRRRRGCGSRLTGRNFQESESSRDAGRKNESRVRHQEQGFRFWSMDIIFNDDLHADTHVDAKIH